MNHNSTNLLLAIGHGDGSADLFCKPCRGLENLNQPLNWSVHLPKDECRLQQVRTTSLALSETWSHSFCKALPDCGALALAQSQAGLTWPSENIFSVSKEWILSSRNVPPFFLSPFPIRASFSVISKMQEQQRKVTLGLADSSVGKLKQRKGKNLSLDPQ